MSPRSSTASGETNQYVDAVRGGGEEMLDIERFIDRVRKDQNLKQACYKAIVLNCNVDLGIGGYYSEGNYPIGSEDWDLRPDAAPFFYVSPADARTALQAIGYIAKDTEPTCRHPEPAWSPDMETTNLSFGQALVAMKAGKKVNRADNGRLPKGVVSFPLHLKDGQFRRDNGYEVTMDADDILATDWQVVE